MEAVNTQHTEELLDRLKPDTTPMSRDEFILIVQRAMTKRGIPERDRTSRLRLYAQMREWTLGKPDDLDDLLKRL